MAVKQMGRVVVHGSKGVRFLGTARLISLVLCLASFSLDAQSIVNWGDMGTPPSGNDFVAIATGWGYSLALRSDGSLVEWGRWSLGPPPAGNDFVAIAAGATHSVALKSDGSLVEWGADIFWGPPPAGNDFVAIAAGDHYSIALKRDGSLVGWGSIYSVPAGNEFVAVAVTVDLHIFALKRDGSLVAGGRGSCHGMPAGNDFVAIAAGTPHSLALKRDSSLVWFGCFDGEGGVLPGNDFVAIAAGLSSMLALKRDGSLVGWEEIGLVPAGNAFVAVGAGDHYGVALKLNSSPGRVAGAGTLIRNGVRANFNINASGANGMPPRGRLSYTELRAGKDVTVQSEDWLSLEVSGNRAILVGRGTLNGVSGFLVMVTAIQSDQRGQKDVLALRVIAPTGAVMPDLSFALQPLIAGGIQVGDMTK